MNTDTIHFAPCKRKTMVGGAAKKIKLEDQDWKPGGGKRKRKTSGGGRSRKKKKVQIKVEPREF